jgi:tetratricopeptide (TPR) repeat protein
MAVRNTEGFEGTQWQEVCLAVCEEQPDEALRLAQEGQEEHPLDPSWSLTLGLVQDLENLPIELPEHLGESAVHELFAVLHPTDRARVDPRHMLALLGAAQIEGWGLWALPRISNLSPQPTLWALMLAERAQQSLGQKDRAERVRIAVTNGHPTFSPAWVRREREAAKRADGDHWAPEIHALRVERRKAAGRQDLQNETRNTLDSALLAWDLGQPDRAQTLLKKYLAKHPNEHELRWVMGRIHASQGLNLQAVGAMYRVWRNLYPVLPTADDGPTGPGGKLPFHPPGSPRTRELLSMIQTTVSAPRSKLNLRDAASLLQDMEAAIPHDPLILLARTRAESQLDDHSTALAEARAMGALELLQDRLSLIGLDPRGELSIEDVAAGSAEMWGTWLLDISPDLAHNFLERELLRAPGRSDLWRLNAQALIALGRIDAARDQLQALNRASHSPRGLLLLAALEARSGAELEVVSSLLAPARSALNPSQTALADFSETWANLQHGAPPGRNLQVLGRLWKERASSTLDLDENTLRLVYYATLVRRNRPQDHTRLKQLADSMLRRGQDSSYLSPTIRAMTGLSAALQAQLELE